MKRRNFILSCILGSLFRPNAERIEAAPVQYKSGKWRYAGKILSDKEFADEFERRIEAKLAHCRGVKSLPRWKPTITLVVLLSLCGVASAQGL